MGRDKAGLTVNGQPLWVRQLATLRRLDPAEIFISGRQDGPYAGTNVEVVPDLTPGRGPLSGLEAALRRADHALVLVLAIDLPEMTTEFLRRLVEAAIANGAGAVPFFEGWYEPLAAVYPRRTLPLVEECLRGDDLSMQEFVRQAMTAKLINPWNLTREDAALFRNVNTPTDLTG